MTTSMLRRRLQRLRDQGERGSILILSVLSALIIIGSAGLAVDVGRLYAAKAELSRAVDAAALSGVLEFNGTAAGLTNASTKACSYLQANEPGASCSGIAPDGANSTLRISASKSVRLYFLPIFGLNTTTVSAKAISGFNNATVDAVMVIDSTASMNGAPLTNAKTAATNFKDTLLGSSPSGNVVVGIAPLRGCYRPSPSSYPDCVYNTQTGSPSPTYVKDLTSNSGQLDNAIAAVTSGGMSATNVCTGLGKGYEVLNSSGGWGYAANHNGPSYPNNRRFMVVLSDADNVYFGQNTYVPGPPKSPNSFAVGASTFDCQPPQTACSGWGTPCHTGVYTSGEITAASDSFPTNSWATAGGTPGWIGSWTATGTAATVNTGTPLAGYHARLASTGAIVRQFNLGNAQGGSLRFYAKKVSTWTTTDRGYAEVSPDNATWYTLQTFTSTTTGFSNSYGTQISLDIAGSCPACIGDSSVYVRFRANTGASTRYFYVETVTIVDPNTDATGFVNGQDGQNYISCTETPAPRERQIDVQTLNIANAIKAQNVEIFVVSFSACPNGDGNTIHNAAGQTTCSSQANPVVSAPASGRVGDTTTETTANMRLAKCIASSTAGTNDHFWYLTDATQLPTVFTTIAAQIAHRLVE
jgi:Flp pilus assembly protein TadG